VRSGVRLALDLGSVRIGVARSDATGTLAVPECTVDARGRWLDEIRDLVTEWDPLELVIGLPVSLDGQERAAALGVRDKVDQIAASVPGVPLRLVDERHTTTIAHTLMHESGISGRRARRTVDQAAAVIMLQQALDVERTSGRPPGVLVDGHDE
jgi:putative Holliday junction resolvase